MRLGFGKAKQTPTIGFPPPPGGTGRDDLDDLDVLDTYGSMER